MTIHDQKLCSILKGDSEKESLVLFAGRVRYYVTYKYLLKILTELNVGIIRFICTILDTNTKRKTTSHSLRVLLLLAKLMLSN